MQYKFNRIHSKTPKYIKKNSQYYTQTHWLYIFLKSQLIDLQLQDTTDTEPSPHH